MFPAWTMLVCSVPHMHHSNAHSGLSSLSHFPSGWLFSSDAHIPPFHFAQFLFCELLREVCPGHLNKFHVSTVPLSCFNSLGSSCVAFRSWSSLFMDPAFVNLLTCWNILVSPRSQWHQQIVKKVWVTWCSDFPWRLNKGTLLPRLSSPAANSILTAVYFVPHFSCFCYWKCFPTQSNPQAECRVAVWCS